MNGNIYLWSVLERSSQEYVGEYQGDNPQARFIYKQGAKITEKVTAPKVVFNDTTINKLKTFHCLESNMMVPIVDETISEILGSLAPNAVQFMDVVVLAKDGELTGYKILNVTKECDDLLDEENTIYNYIPSTEHIFGFDQFKYKKGCLGDNKIARNKIYHGHLIVSHEIKETLEKIENLGVNFINVS